MILNNENSQKISNLLNIPINTVEYMGCHSKDTICFNVGVTINNNLISGVTLTINEDFKILKVERINVTWGRYTNKIPVVKEKLPIHPMGQTISIHSN